MYILISKIVLKTEMNEEKRTGMVSRPTRLPATGAVTAEEKGHGEKLHGVKAQIPEL